MNAPRLRLSRLQAHEPVAANGSAPTIRPRERPQIPAPASPTPTKRQKRLLQPLPIAGLVLVLIALIGYLAVYNSSRRRTQVLIAARALPAGTVLSASDLRSSGLAAEASTLSTMLPAHDASRVVGQRLASPVAAGAPVPVASLAGRSASTSTIVLSVPDGEINAENLQPGDRVAVLATFTSGNSASTRPIARNLQVLSVGMLSTDEQASTSTVPVAVALTNPESASQIALANEAGKIDLLLEGAGASTAAIPQATEGGNP